MVFRGYVVREIYTHLSNISNIYKGEIFVIFRIEEEEF